MLGDDGDDVALPEVEGALVATGELGEGLDVVVLAGASLDDVLVQQIFDLTWKRQKSKLLQQ